MRRFPALATLTVFLAACSFETEGACSSDDDCGYDQVCDAAAAECVDAPGDCRGYCQKRSTCSMEEYDYCIKTTCGESFLGYYGEAYGDDCEQAWLDLFECNGNLGCDELERYNDEVDAENGTAPYCQTELQAKNSEC